jgi:hypothetical protein
METPETPTDIAIKRIRLFFPLPGEEHIAVALTEFWGSRAGSRIVDLKPEMTMREVLDLAKDHLWSSPEFAHMLELAGIEAFDDQFEQMTLRDFVRYAAIRRSESAEPGAPPNGGSAKPFGNSKVSGGPPSVS